MISLAATVFLSAALAPHPAEPAGAGAARGPSIRWVERSGRVVVEVVDLDPAQTDRLGRLEPRDPRWLAALSVRVAQPAGASPMVGSHELDGNILRFTPRYPLLAGMQYTARYQAEFTRSTGLISQAIESVYSAPVGPAGPAAEVSAVYPSGDRLPENLLKVYIQFSAPMARGEGYRRVHLLDGKGSVVERPFLEIGEELWDASGTRLTLLFDPGRIKRGLVPREEEGPILEEEKRYTLVVDAGWPDADGRPLRDGFRKAFRAGPPDDVQPDPSSWTFAAPGPQTREPLVVRFPEPMDQAILRRAIGVESAGAAIAGRVEVGPGETSWRFVPDRAWPDGPISLRVDTELEDLAGNSIARPFEVDVVRRPVGSPAPPRITVPVPRPR